MPSQLFFLQCAQNISERSKDPSTKVGAFIVDQDGSTPLGFGYNGMPRGMPDDDPVKTQRPEKYLWFEHAERNAIYNSVRPLLKDSTMFLTDFPNMEAARAIVSSGINTVVIDSRIKNADPSLHEHFSRVVELFQRSRVDMIDLGRPDKISLLGRKISSKELKKHDESVGFVSFYGKNFPENASGEASLILHNETLAPISMAPGVLPESLKLEEKIGQESAKNAIFNLGKQRLKGSSIYTSWCPCADCALAIASCSIKKVVTFSPDFKKENDARWKESFEKSSAVLKALGIEMEMIQPEVKKVNKFTF